ncbi:MAG: TolC family protein, partial [Erythrobacter sp.]
MIRRLASMAALGALAAALGGCTIVGEDYDRPELALPESHAVALEPGEARSAANTAWFELYDDPELRPLIEEALEDNLDLQQAFARIEEVRARLLVARSGFFPRIDGSLSTG